MVANGDDPGKLGGLKRLQSVLAAAAPSADIHSLMSPLYILYDLRVACSHLTSADTANKLMEKVTSRLQLDATSGLLDIYPRLVQELLKSFTALKQILAAPSFPPEAGVHGPQEKLG
jgi:tRNA isopentenyl-2-thiomethyl-A-37 hydroxylase MiaE